jgi:hypothetical protein
VLLAVILLCVRDGEAGPPAELLRGAHVVLVERLLVHGTHERERSEDMRLRDDGDHDLRAIAHPSHELRVADRGGVLLDHVLVEDRDEKRDPRLRHPDSGMDAKPCIVQQRGADVLEHAVHRGVTVRSRRDVEPIGMLVDQIEETQIGERFDGHLCDVIERLVDLEGPVKHLTRTDEERETLLRPIDRPTHRVALPSLS